MCLFFLLIFFEAAAQKETPRGLEQRASPARLSYDLGKVYYEQGKYSEALRAYDNALHEFDRIKPPLATDVEANFRRELAFARGSALWKLRRYEEASDSFRLAIELDADQENVGRVWAHANLGGIHKDQGNLARALESFETAFEIANQLKEAPADLLPMLLVSIGDLRTELGDYQKSLDAFQMALERSSTGDALTDEVKAILFANMGRAYFRTGQVERAIEYYERALLFQQQGDGDRVKALTLNNLGFAYASLERYAEALQVLDQALSLAASDQDEYALGRVRDSRGTVYLRLGQHSHALKEFHKALAIQRHRTGDRSGAHVTLANIGRAHLGIGQKDIAVWFLYQAIIGIEHIRAELGTLPKKERQGFADSVYAAYRDLVALLRSEGRFEEAEAILNLHREDELDKYLGGVPGPSVVTDDYAWDEQTLHKDAVSVHLDAHLADAVKVYVDLTELEAIEKSGRLSEEELELRSELDEEAKGYEKRFINFAKSAEVKEALQRRPDHITYLVEVLRNLKAHLPKDSLVLYPLILRDRLELIFSGTQDYATNAQTVPVTRLELEHAVKKHRDALARQSIDVKATGFELYRMLVKPIEVVLNELSIRTVIYIPEGMLRYVPLASLYDGKDWLIKRFAVDRLNALTLAEVGRPPVAIRRVLAGAFPGGGDDEYLPGARSEVEVIASLFEETTELYNNDFSLERVESALRNEQYQVVHLATHAAFSPARYEDSFILFANAERASLDRIDRWDLLRVGLVVLSACETGHGAMYGEGEEIAGFTYRLLKRGSRSVIASLWKVHDGGTQALMSAFYRHLWAENASVAEALQKAQLELLEGGPERLVRDTTERSARGLRPSVDDGAFARGGYEHPFYWASFVLFGVGI